MKMPEMDIKFTPLEIRGELAREILVEVRRKPTEGEVIAMRNAKMHTASVNRDVLVELGLIE